MAWNDILETINQMNDPMSLDALKARTNSQAAATNAQFANIPKPKPQQGGIAGLGGTVMQLGGTAANLLGQPEIGIPLTIGGSALSGGATGGITGAAMGAGKSAVGAGLTAGLGSILPTSGSAPGASPDAPLLTGSKLSAPLGAAVKDPNIMNSLGGNTFVSPIGSNVSTPYSSMSGMDVMKAMNPGGWGGS